MDPVLGGEILATIIWFVVGDLFVAGVGIGVFALFGFIAVATERAWIGVVGLVLAWIAGIAAAVLVWWNIIMHALAAGSLIWGW